ncbi:MAG: helix-turn-helix transcriptional regulator [Crocinitomicaceae bacterium]|nr:helix-turn-helix transcriptional regulator [Crocinitomicaceae bacterium]
MLINDRIRLILKANNLTSSEFADTIGVKRSNLSHVLSGRNKPGLEFLAKIIEAFPNVNASWLLTGTQRTGDFQEEVVDVKPSEKVNAQIGVTTTDSEIEKIVVFYKNGTFSSHLPSAQ